MASLMFESIFDGCQVSGLASSDSESETTGTMFRGRRRRSTTTSSGGASDEAENDFQKFLIANGLLDTAAEADSSRGGARKMSRKGKEPSDEDFLADLRGAGAVLVKRGRSSTPTPHPSPSSNGSSTRSKKTSSASTRSKRSTRGNVSSAKSKKLKKQQDDETENSSSSFPEQETVLEPKREAAEEAPPQLRQASVAANDAEEVDDIFGEQF